MFTGYLPRLHLELHGTRMNITHNKLTNSMHVLSALTLALLHEQLSIVCMVGGFLAWFTNSCFVCPVNTYLNTLAMHE